jgi:hypothetical protein
MTATARRLLNAFASPGLVASAWSSNVHDSLLACASFELHALCVLCANTYLAVVALSSFQVERRPCP